MSTNLYTICLHPKIFEIKKFLKNPWGRSCIICMSFYLCLPLFYLWQSTNCVKLCKLYTNCFLTCIQTVYSPVYNLSTHLYTNFLLTHLQTVYTPAYKISNQLYKTAYSPVYKLFPVYKFSSHLYTICLLTYIQTVYSTVYTLPTHLYTNCLLTSLQTVY